MSEGESFEGWCILELMGHRRLAGYVREQEIAGAGFLRLDVPAEGNETASTQFYPPSSVYCLTPVVEDIARAVARSNRPAPVSRYELPAPRPASSGQADYHCRECGEPIDEPGLCPECEEAQDNERASL